MDFVYLYTSFDGRINRAKYWLATIIFGILVLVIMVALVYALAMSMDADDFTFRAIIFVFYLITLYPSTAVMVKRLHDRNRPGYFAAFMLGPILLSIVATFLGLTGDAEQTNALDWIIGLAILGVGVWFFIELGCLRGTIGDNQYGPDPLAGKV